MAMNYFMEADYPPSANISAGLYYNIVFPRNFGRFALCNQLLYYAYKTKSFYDSAITTSLGMNYILINTLARYKFPVGNSDLFLLSGTSIGFGFNETNHQKYDETSSYRASDGKAFKEMEKFHLGINIGIEFRFKKYSIEGRYMYGFRKYDFVDGGGSVPSSLNALNIMIGYQF